MANRRFKDQEWFVTSPDGKLYEQTNQAQHLAVLMDIRDEMQKLNAILHCPNFVQIPSILRQIDRNTKKKRKTRATAKPVLRVVAR